MSKSEYQSEYYLANRAKMLERAKKHYAENKEQKAEYDREYRKKNRVKLNANSAIYHAANKEKLNKQAAARFANRTLDQIARRIIWKILDSDNRKIYEAARRKANPRRAAKASKAWKDAHPEARRNYVRNRRAKLRDGGTLSKNIEQKLMALQKGLCPACKASLKKAFHLDHIIAVAKGGRNEDSNVQLLCPPCNQSKSDKNPIDFMQSRGFLL